jgi:hypothetical protein
MALRLIKEIEGYDYPVGTYLRVLPLFNSTHDIVPYELYENEDARLSFKQNLLNPNFRTVVETHEHIGESLTDRLKNEIPENTTSILDATATMFYQELRKTEKFSVGNWEDC